MKGKHGGWKMSWVCRIKTKKFVPSLHDGAPNNSLVVVNHDLLRSNTIHNTQYKMHCSLRPSQQQLTRKRKIHWFLHLRLGHQPRPHHLIQHLLLTLRLLCILTRTMPKPRDIFLHTLDLILLPIILLHLILFQFRLGFDVLIVVSIVVFEFAFGGEVDGVGGDIVEKILGVGDEEEDFVPFGEVVF